jgi:hypothetical protein
MSVGIENHSGSKYVRWIRPCVEDDPTTRVDVYSVLVAFNVTCPATQHAVKKLLCTGLRGKADALTDLTEARDSISRAIEIAKGGG